MGLDITEGSSCQLFVDNYLLLHKATFEKVLRTGKQVIAFIFLLPIQKTSIKSSS
jgi:hypothetical protein